MADNNGVPTTEREALELQVKSQQSAAASAGRFEELGTTGLNAFYGFVREAYLPDLTWPGAQPVYNRMRRSVPEIAMVRMAYDVLLPNISIGFEAPTDKPEDVKAADFGNEVLDDLEGGIGRWAKTAANQVPFFGWGWWVEVLGVRTPSWRPPDRNDPWKSKYADGRIGLRRLAFRDTSSWESWDLDDATGRLLGMNQLDPPNEAVSLPIERSVHLVYGGDYHNPEGWTPLEAMYRLERYKHALEIVQGIGFEHSAGYAKFTSDRDLTEKDKQLVREAAYAILTAQETNYLALPKHIDADIISVGFPVAAAILAAVRYYGLVMLQLYMMQFVAQATTADTGAYASVQDASTMFVNSVNATVKGFVEQLDEQFGRRLFEVHNPGVFNYSERPRLSVLQEIDKDINLSELATFFSTLDNVITLTEEDFRLLREKSNLLSETVPEEDTDEYREQKRAEAEAQAEELRNRLAGKGDEGEDEDDEERNGEGSADVELARGAIDKRKLKALAWSDEVLDRMAEPTDADVTAARRWWILRASAEYKSLLESQPEDVLELQGPLSESAIMPEFRWNAAAKRYIRTNGQFVSGTEVRQAIDQVIEVSRRQMENLSLRLQNGEVTLGTWQAGMAREIKLNQLAHAAAARGGWAQMTPADYGNAGVRIRQQYEFLRTLANDISSGDVALDGRFLQRAGLYAEAGRTTYHEVHRREMAKIGFDQERNVLDPTAKHCDGCLAEDAKGAQPIGQMVPIGQRDCVGNDRCTVEYINSATGERRT